MSMIEHVTISELQNILTSLQLPKDIRFNVTFDDYLETKKAIKKQKAKEAMEKLRGSGNGNLVNILLTERRKDTLL